jgi:hypothetical protein
VHGGRTEVTTQLAGGVRTARAVVTADRLTVFGGLFTFEAPRWEATAESGGRTTSVGSFSFGSATVLGVPRSAAEALADLEGFKQGLEQLLAPLGVVMELPRVERRDDGLRVTPLGFRIANPPFGRDVLVPFLGAVDPLVQSFRQQLLDEDCKNANVLTVLDVLLGVIAGSGTVEVLAGGVDVATRATDYSVPPAVLPATDDGGDGSADEVTLGAADLGLGAGFEGPGLEELGPTEFGSVPLEDLAAVELGAAPAVEAPSTSTSPEVGAEEAALPASVSRMEDGTAGSAAVGVGLAAVLGSAALALGDRLVGRRARRSIP